MRRNINLAFFLLWKCPERFHNFKIFFIQFPTQFQSDIDYLTAVHTIPATRVSDMIGGRVYLILNKLLLLCAEPSKVKPQWTMRTTQTRTHWLGDLKQRNNRFWPVTLFFWAPTSPEKLANWRKMHQEVSRSSISRFGNIENRTVHQFSAESDIQNSPPIKKFRGQQSQFLCNSKGWAGKNYQ